MTYRRRTSDEYDRKLVELLRETGRINARMVRIALDLDAAAASRVLADLVERELLVKTSNLTARRRHRSIPDRRTQATRDFLALHVQALGTGDRWPPAVRR